MNQQAYIELEDQFGTHNYKPLDDLPRCQGQERVAARTDCGTRCNSSSYCDSFIVV